MQRAHIAAPLLGRHDGELTFAFGSSAWNSTVACETTRETSAAELALLPGVPLQTGAAPQALKVMAVGRDVEQQRAEEEFLRRCDEAGATPPRCAGRRRTDSPQAGPRVSWFGMNKKTLAKRVTPKCGENEDAE